MTPPARPGVAPAPVLRASALWGVTVALSLTGIALDGVGILSAAPGGFLTPSSTMSTTTGVAGVLVLPVLAAVLGLILVLARRMRAGRNWARLILAAVGTYYLITLVNQFEHVETFYRLAATAAYLVAIATAVWAVVLSFLPDAEVWFRRP